MFGTTEGTVADFEANAHNANFVIPGLFGFGGTLTYDDNGNFVSSAITWGPERFTIAVGSVTQSSTTTTSLSDLMDQVVKGSIDSTLQNANNSAGAAIVVPGMTNGGFGGAFAAVIVVNPPQKNEPEKKKE